MEHITNSGKSWNITNQITSNVYGDKMGNSSKKNLISGDVPAIPIPMEIPGPHHPMVFVKGHEFMAEISNDIHPNKKLLV